MSAFKCPHGQDMHNHRCPVCEQEDEILTLRERVTELEAEVRELRAERDAPETPDGAESERSNGCKLSDDSGSPTT